MGNGQVKNEIDYKNGNVHGKWIGWYQKNLKRTEADYYDGKEHGKHIEWYSNGNKKVETFYNEGIEHGIRTMWYESGQIKAELTMKNGQVVKVIMWNEEGVIIMNTGAENQLIKKAGQETKIFG